MQYPDVPIPLCICIDYQESNENREVYEIAANFNWPHGDVEVILQEENLGLKKHVITCGDLTKKYGSIIMLEDDLFLSPDFYFYATSALLYYEREDSIAGISLYNHKLNFLNRQKFEPVNDGNDVYFLQIASSWGQAWTPSQWEGFRNWLLKHPTIPTDASLPGYIKSWPDKSWLKHYIWYLVDTKKYFVYPRFSLSTNFGDQGENNIKSNTFYQVSLLQGKRMFQFVPIKDSYSIYDSFFEINLSVLSKLWPHVLNLDVTLNLYSEKKLSMIDTEYVISPIASQKPILSFGRKLKPHELNVIYEVPGQDFFLSRTEDLRIKEKKSWVKQELALDYYIGPISIRQKASSLIRNILIKILAK